MADLTAIAALALDGAIGWPRGLYRRVGHPVGLFAWLIARCEAAWNRPDHGFWIRRVLGVLTLMLLLFVTIAAAVALQWGTEALLGRAAWIGLAVLAWPALAQRSLFDHVRPIATALDAGDLPAAREAVSAIVGRDTARLDEAGVARAAIESLAESLCDGVVAPLFWLALLGLPGVWAYKAVNTADSLIGHYEPRWRAFGWAAARLDDALNLAPARLSGLLLCLAGGGGWRVLRRDAGNHASPNAGWPEAAMAGALRLRLAGPIAYDGVRHDKPWIGAEGRNARAHDVARALRLYLRACLLLWLATGAAIWAM
ncbi:MAG: adenosylcobinamide-phosphate synthase CbiB [Pseudomonadota bacterium]|uniref:adenosylcobinamide-phosphate synthase CbiB n=1 Tax=Sphingobium naphthae TaxID=1886786 RepID=UPI002B184E77|nr:adenosylcobinamide-phosphate synthase CbiB [Pseudomonadota bacterium]